MKFLCECGQVIRDQTDNLSYKAYSCPDQSREDAVLAIDRLMEAPDKLTEKQHQTLFETIMFPAGWRHLYQCPQCARVYIEDGGKLHCFKPEHEDTPRNLFQAHASKGETI